MKSKLISVLFAFFLLFAPPVIAGNDVQINRDDKGVWLISGSDDADLYDVYEVMGYAVACDRLWQAEKFRRAARGTLAEIFGPGLLGQDILVRTTGYSDLELSQGFENLDEITKKMINGYVAGFNRRITEIQANPTLLPFEFAALGQQLGIAFIPQAWTPEDVLAWVSLMLRNFDPEAQKQGQLDNARLFETLITANPEGGANMFNDLRLTNDPEALTYISSPESVSRTASKATGSKSSPTSLCKGLPDIRSAASRIEKRFANMEDNLERINARVKMGSYAWVVDGSKTASGNPILYSGPQMGFSVPSIILEGSVRAGGLHVSGMGIAGIPGIVIGRTAHHAWSMQVGHAHTVDYYLISANDIDPAKTRNETFKIAGKTDLTIPVCYTKYGPVIEPLPSIDNPGPFDFENYDGPIVAWRYAHRNYEFKTLRAYYDLAKAQSMDQFGAAIENVAVSQHFCYADKDGNIAYWMSGRDPKRVETYDYRFPQGALNGVPLLDWDDTILKERSHDRNTSKGYYSGWNNKTSKLYSSSANNPSYYFGPFHRAHVVDEYLAGRENLTFEQVRDLALNIAATDSFGAGGNPWHFVKERFTAAVNASPSQERTEALNLLAGWDGHFVEGGNQNWASGTQRPDPWVLMDKWIKKVLRLTFDDELVPLGLDQRDSILFNVLLRGLSDTGTNGYDWFSNSTAGSPGTSESIIVAALDQVLAELGPRPWNVARGTIDFEHEIVGKVHAAPFSSRSTYAHCVEMGPYGPVRIESMFPLGESGDMRVNPANPTAPVLDTNFLSMTSVYDDFSHRSFPLHVSVVGQISTMITGQNSNVLGAVITIMETGQTAATDSNGKFELSDVLPGSYTLKVEKPGFETIILKDIVVAGDVNPVQPEILPIAGRLCIPGDTDNDNIVEIEDAIEILQTLSGDH